MKQLFVIFLLFVSNVLAEDFRVGNISNDWRLVHSRQAHHDHLEVRFKDKVLFEYKADLVTQKLLQSGLVKFKKYKEPFLVTVWTSGVHGQELIVFDLAKKDVKDPKDAIAYLYGSAWTIDLKIDQEKIKIKGKTEVDEKSGEPADQNLTFSP